MFLVSKTFDVVTPESAEHGDVERRGFCWDEQKMSLRDLLSECRDLGTLENWTRVECCGRYNGMPSQSLYGTDTDENYRNGESTSYAIHIKASAANMRRLQRFLVARKLISMFGVL